MQKKNAAPPLHPTPTAWFAENSDFPPVNEDVRLDTLRSYAVLDTPPEAAFDRLTSLAAHVFDVPVSAISLVDRDRLWLKSCGGPSRAVLPPEAARSSAPCSQVVEMRRVVAIEDTLHAPCFFDLLQKIGPSPLRFYAGAPLLAPNGAVVGTLCVMDVCPREFPQSEQDMLRDLAASVVSELELRRARLAAAEMHTLQRQMFSQNPYPMWVFDAETLGFLDVNEAALALYGCTRAEFLALTVLDIRPAEERSDLQAHLRRLIASGMPGKRGIWRHQTSSGRLIWADVSSHPVQFGGRNALMAIAEDVTERVRTEDALRRSEQKFDVPHPADAAGSD